MSTADGRDTVAVLGATGCMGRHICAAFAGQGSRVLAVARHHAPDVGPYRFLPLDIAACPATDLARTFADEGVGTVVNAILGWGRTEEEMDHSNVRPVRAVIEALRRLRTPPRLVHLGTIHEYGPVPYGTSLDEEAEPRPESLYARSKLTASRMVVDAVSAGDVDGAVLRLTNTVGPHPAMESFFGSLARRLRHAHPADGLDVTVADAERDYVDVRDAVDAVLRAARSPLGDPLLNIGRGEAVGIRTLVRELVAASGLPAEAVREHSAEVRSRSTGADWIQVDITRARRTLGWRPRHSLAASMRAMWETVD